MEGFKPILPFRSFSTRQIADFLGLLYHVCVLLKVNIPDDLYLCYPFQKQNLFITYTVQTILEAFIVPKP